MPEKKTTIAFLVPYPTDTAPGQRFRFEQYFPFLNEKYNLQVFPFLSQRAFDIFYKKGGFFAKLFRFLQAISHRKLILLKIKKADVVFVYREVAMIGTPVFEWIIVKLFKKRMIFDFDDSIWLHSVSDANKIYGFIKSSGKTKKIISLSYLVVAGNKYLADYALKYNNNVTIVPTTIDTDEYVKVNLPRKNPEKIIIGWSGSITTIQHFEYAVPILKKLKKKYADKIAFKVIGDSNYHNSELGIQGIAWRKETEIPELSSFDIGIMPLPDDEWAKGKCGLKGLQYMALEIATIMSPVGVNTEIITDSENGFLASTEDEWFNKLSLLIDFPELRKKLGKEGRNTVVEKYSVHSQKNRYLQIFEKLINK